MVNITGMGVLCATALDVESFDEALRTGRTGVSFADPGPGLPKALGLRARLPAGLEPVVKERADALRLSGMDDKVVDRVVALASGVSRSAGYSLLAAVEAYERAGLAAIADRRRVALVVAGSNFTHELSFRMAERFRNEPNYVSPRYAHQFWDSDMLGVVSEALDIHGEGMTVAGASAAGNIGLIQGMRLIQSGCADACLVVAAMQDLSDVELMSFANLGALAVPRVATEPERCCCPFDVGHQGFVFGEGVAAIVLEAADVTGVRGVEPLAVLRDGASALDGHHLTQPSQDGQEFVMREALRRSGVDVGEVDLVSAHATSTPLGDKVESKAIGAVLGALPRRPWVNATKSLIGHCLGPASMIEAIACVLQMRGGYVHPNANLTEPITDELRFAPVTSVAADIRYALSNSFGFGGINTSILLESTAAATAAPGARKE